MGLVLVLHQGLSRMSWMFFLVLGAWGLYRSIRGQGIDGNYLGASVVGQILFVLQGVIGVILWVDGRLPNLLRPEVHILYGAFVVVFSTIHLSGRAEGRRLESRHVGHDVFDNVFVWRVATFNRFRVRDNLALLKSQRGLSTSKPGLRQAQPSLEIKSCLFLFQPILQHLQISRRAFNLKPHGIWLKFQRVRHCGHKHALFFDKL